MWAGISVMSSFRNSVGWAMLLRFSVCPSRSRARSSVSARILVTCDDDNIGSIRTIEKNGGILENVVSGPDLDKPKRRYWIEAG